MGSQAPVREEIATLATDPHVTAFQTVLSPTDEVLTRKGGADYYKIYDEIKKDPHAFAVLQKRKTEVCSREWNVFEASSRRLDRKAAELVQNQLKSIDFDRLTRGLMGAVLKGFAVAEVLWVIVDGVWTVSAIKVRKQRRFRFTIDGELRLITRESMMEGVPVPDRKFIVHRHSIDDDDDDPYGVGLGAVLYWPAWFKRQALAHWLRSNERHAAPTVDAAYQGSYDEARQNQVLKAVRSLASDGAIAHPDSVVLNLLEAKGGGGGDLHEKLNRYLDELMSEAVLGETLSTNSGERGARNLGEIHNQIRLAIAKADADWISTTLKSTLIRWIVELNLPGAAVPDVWRDFSETEDLDKSVERDKTLVDMGYRPKDVAYINDKYGGDWVEKDQSQDKQTPAATPPTAEQQADVEGQFADHSHDQDDDPTASLANQLGELAAPEVDAMLDIIRREVDLAVSYEDLSERLLRLSGTLPIDGFASLIEQALTVADLDGRDSVNRNG